MNSRRLRWAAGAFVLLAFVAAAYAVFWVRHARIHHVRHGGGTLRIVVSSSGPHVSEDLAVLLRRIDAADMDAVIERRAGNLVTLRLEHVPPDAPAPIELIAHHDLAVQVVMDDQSDLEAMSPSVASYSLSTARFDAQTGEDPSGSTRYRSYQLPVGADPVSLGPMLAALPARSDRVARIQCSDRDTAPQCTAWLLQLPPILTHRDVVHAEPVLDMQRGGSNISITLDARAAERFATATQANRHRRIAIVLDGMIISMPIVAERISGGHIVITQGRSMDPASSAIEARRLASAFDGGSLQDSWVLESIATVPGAVTR